MSKGFGKIPPHLSLCMIVKNEAQNLPNCLNSIKNLVDEIIIVDTGSTDHTINIARQYTKQIYKIPWQDDFSHARNYSLSRASGKWILILDGDEILLDTIIPTLKQLTQQPQLIAINLVLRQEINAHQAPYSTVCRLFRNRPDLKFWGIYHETIENHLSQIQQKEPHWQIAHLDQPAIAHYGYSRAEIDRKQKYAFSQRLMEKHLATHGSDPYIQNKLGALQISTGNLNQAIAYLLQSWQTIQTQPDQNNLKFEILYHLGYAYEKLQEWHLAQTYYEQALTTPTSSWKN